MASKVKLDVSALRTSQCLDLLLQTQNRNRLRLKSDIPIRSLGKDFTQLSIGRATFWARSNVHVLVGSNIYVTFKTGALLEVINER